MGDIFLLMNPTMKKGETRITIDNLVGGNPDAVSPSKLIICGALGFVGIPFHMDDVGSAIEVFGIFWDEGVSPLLNPSIMSGGMYSIRVPLDP